MSNEQNNASPIAYLTEDGERCITAKTYNTARNDGGAIWSTMRPFCVPAYATPPAAAPAPAVPQGEPFGYFRAEPFGWTDCVATDEGAIALYERPAAPAVPQGWKLAPVEPTPEMKAAGVNIEVYSEVSDSIGALTWAEVAAIYRAMLAATPATPSQPVTDEVFAALELDPEAFRTEGGAVNAGKLKAAILHPYNYLPPDHWLQARFSKPGGRPLATDQATLTDEEIDKIADEYEDPCGRIRVDQVFPFSRAIIAALREKGKA